MGQAKKRGTFEERRDSAIARDKHIIALYGSPGDFIPVPEHNERCKTIMNLYGFAHWMQALRRSRQ